MKQEPPFAIQIEPTEGCTLACSFCALQSIRDNGADSVKGAHGKNSPPYRFMTLETAHAIADSTKRAGWNPRIEFAMHGEPTVNPNIGSIIQAFRKALPKVSMMLTTNGSGLLKEQHICNVFNCGINTIAFDAYDHAPWKERATVALTKYAVTRNVPVYYYPADKNANPHQRFHGQRIVVIADISTLASGTHQLTNQGGNSIQHGQDDPAPVGLPLLKRCAKPFRELSIRWDGSVALCCDDWQGQYKIGNAVDMRIEALWNHPRFVAARTALYDARRDLIGVCSGCDVTTYRNGLLPDKMGKQEMGKLNGIHMLQIKEAQRGKAFSIKPV